MNYSSCTVTGSSLTHSCQSCHSCLSVHYSYIHSIHPSPSIMRSSLLSLVCAAAVVLICSSVSVVGEEPLMIMQQTYNQLYGVIFDPTDNTCWINFGGMYGSAGFAQYSANGSLITAPFFPRDVSYIAVINRDPTTGDWLVGASANRAFTRNFHGNFSVMQNYNYKQGISLFAQVAADTTGLIYAPSFTLGTVSIITPAGDLVESWPTGAPAAHYIKFDSQGNMYVGTTYGVMRTTRKGQILQVYNTSFTPAPNGARAIDVDVAGNIFFSDLGNSRVVKMDKNGVFLREYSTDDKVMTPWGLSLDPVSGNIWVGDIGNSRVVVFKGEKPAPSCTTGEKAGSFSLDALTIDGADLIGFNPTRNTQFYWSACGAVRDDYCQKFAPGSTVCANTDNTGAAAVARGPESSIEWTLLRSGPSAPNSGVTGFLRNGDSCGRYNLPSALVITLFCAKEQDKTFLMDDSAVSPSSALCTYNLIMFTPVVC